MSGKRPSVDVAVGFYRLLLRVLLPELSAEFGDEMTELFAVRLQRGRTKGRMAVFGLWASTLADLATTAWEEWRGRDGVTLHPASPSRLHDNRRAHPMIDLLQETRTAARRLGRTPMFTGAVLVIVALGIGANTAAFTFVNTFLLRPPSWHEPERVVNVYQDSDDGEPNSTSFPAYRDMAAETGVFEAVAASTPVTLRLTTDQGQSQVAGEFVTSDFLEVFGLRPLLGSSFSAEHDRVGSGLFALVNHRTWKSRFGGDPDIVGRSVELNGEPVTIVGVGPPAFVGNLKPVVTDFWLSISSVALGGEFRVANLERREDHWYDVKARLAPGATPQMAQAAMDRLAGRLEREFPSVNTDRDITVFAYGDVRVHPDADRDLKPMAAAILGVVGLVLLLACGNLANLLLVRGLGRLPDIAIRRTLGAGRAAIARTFLVESMLLSLGGGLLGILLARWILALVPLLPIPLPAGGRLELTMDWRVLSFTLALVVVTGCLFGLAPALRGISSDFVAVMRDGSRGSSPGRWVGLFRGGMVALQVAASIVLVVICGLVLRNLSEAMDQGAGVDADRVAYAQVDLSPLDLEPEERAVVWRELEGRVGSLAGMERVSLTSRLPANGRGGSTTTVIDGYRPVSGTGAVELLFAYVGPEYFEVMGQAVLEGRSFDEADDGDALRVAIVNETAARRYFSNDAGKGTGAVGGRLRPQSDPDAWVQVVGVVADTKVRSLTEPPTPLMFRPAGQARLRGAFVVARTAMDPAIAAGAMAAEMRSLRDRIDIAEAGVLDQFLRSGLSGPRTVSRVLAVFAVLALLLASLGIYAVVSYGVARRTGEIGIRIALGAARGSVVSMVVREVLVAVVVGAAVGFGVSFAVAMEVRDALPAIGTFDPQAFLAGALLLGLTAAVAAYVPARRASSADPAAALRAE